MHALLRLWLMVLCSLGVFSLRYFHRSLLLGSICASRSGLVFRGIQSYTLSHTASACDIVKKSKFVSHAAPVASFDDAMAFLDKVKDTKANHNCWAYRSSITSRCSDDGEPAGTAGRPILNILETEQIVDAVIIVTRYFGGIKLGAGGLVRAYAGAAKSVIAQIEKKLVVPTTIVKLKIPMENVGAVYNLFEQLQGKVNGEQYRKLSEEFVVQTGDDNQLSQDAMMFTLQIPADSMNSFHSSIADICRGQEVYIVDIECTN